MQYPGVSPFGGFGGTGILTNQLKPQSLEQRKQQLVHQMVTGSNTSNLTVGAGQGDAPGRAPGLGFNPFMTSYLNSLSAIQDPNSPFFGGGGAPTPSTPSPSNNPVNNPIAIPNQPAGGVGSGAGPEATGAGAPVIAAQGALVNNPTAPAGPERRLLGDWGGSPGGIVGAHNMYYGFNPGDISSISAILAGRTAGRVF